MADENEDQWLYGDAAEAREHSRGSVEREHSQNDERYDGREETSMRDEARDEETANGTSEVNQHNLQIR